MTTTIWKLGLICTSKLARILYLFVMFSKPAFVAIFLLIIRISSVGVAVLEELGVYSLDDLEIVYNAEDILALMKEKLSVVDYLKVGKAKLAAASSDVAMTPASRAAKPVPGYVPDKPDVSPVEKVKLRVTALEKELKQLVTTDDLEKELASAKDELDGTVEQLGDALALMRDEVAELRAKLLSSSSASPLAVAAPIVPAVDEVDVGEYLCTVVSRVSGI